MRAASVKYEVMDWKLLAPASSVMKSNAKSVFTPLK